MMIMIIFEEQKKKENIDNDNNLGTLKTEKY